MQAAVVVFLYTVLSVWWPHATVQAQTQLLQSSSSSLVPINSNQDISYSCTFVNLWSAARHPNLYPSDAHWSDMVMVAHNSEYQMWAPGILASEGVESVAEVRCATAAQAFHFWTVAVP